MRQISFAWFVLATWVAAPALGQDSRAQLDEKAVLRAIEGAKQRLIAAQLPDGSWPDPGWNHEPQAKLGGHTALCTYALLQAGESPNSPVIRKAAEALTKIEMYGTYNTALRCMVFAKLARWDTTGAWRKVLNRDATFLVRTNLPNGQWTYVSPVLPRNLMRTVRNTGDNSNSQLAVLALREAYYAGAEIPRPFWQKLEKYWSKQQQPDGGWTYGGNGRSYGSMTAAGLATSFILLDVLHTGRCCTSTTYAPIEGGLAWMARNFRASQNPGRGGAHYYYYLYGVERVGEASGYRYFGTQDWFVQGANALLSKSKVGAWRGGTKFSGTAFGLIFLAKGVAPVLLNKLDYGKGWNTNPRDAANVTRFLSHYKFERPLNWQIVRLDTPAADWHDSPVLFLSLGAKDFSSWTDEQRANVRTFIDTGGTLWIDSPCRASAKATTAVRRFMSRLYPNFDMKRLAADHPLFSVQFKIQKRPEVYGLSNGLRELILFSKGGVSCAWQKYRHKSDRQAFELAGNVYLYASDKHFESKLHPHSTLARTTLPPGQTIRIAHLKHASNWNPCPTALSQLSAVMAKRTGVGLEIETGVECSDSGLETAQVAFLTGRGPLALTDDNQDALKRFIARGGLLVVSPAAGDRAFGRTAETMLGTLGGGRLVPVPADDALVTGAYSKHKGFDASQVQFSRALRIEKRADRRPVLKGVKRDGKWAVVFTPYDLVSGMALQTPYNGRGYYKDHASRLATNLFLAAVDVPAPKAAADPSKKTAKAGK